MQLLEKRSGIYSDRPYMPMLDLYVALSSAFSHYSYITWISEWDGSDMEQDLWPMVPDGDPTDACIRSSLRLRILQDFIQRKQRKHATFYTEF